MRVRSGSCNTGLSAGFPVHVGFQQGCPLLPVMFIIFRDTICRHNQGKMEHQIGRQIGAVSAVIRLLHQSVVVKEEVSRKVKLLIYWSICIPTLYL